MIRKAILILSILFLCNNQNANAQEDTLKTPLETILKTLEEKFDVRFSYADENVKDFSINNPDYNSPLTAILAFIENNTSLIFIAINESAFAIKRTDELIDLTTLQNLEEVIIDTYLTQGMTLNDDGSTTIKPKYFGILPGLIEPDILKTIQALPSVTSVDERISDLNVRGGTNDQNLILWEGVKMYQTGHFFGLISAFNPHLTNRVSVSKNGTSAQYGDGISSVIDIQNNNNITEKFSAGIGANLIDVDAYGIIPLNKKLELQLSARRSLTDFWITPTYDEYFNRVFQNTEITEDNNNDSDDDTFYFYDTSAKLIYKPSEKDQLSISILNIFNSLEHEEGNQENNSNTSTSRLQQKSLAATIHYNRKWSDKLRTKAQVYISQYNLDATNFDLLNNQRLTQENEIIDQGLKLHINYEIDDYIKYQGGYQFSEIAITNLERVNNPLFRNISRDINRTHAIFNEIKYTTASKNTAIKFGIRTNYFEKFAEINTEPRLSFSQRISDDFRIEVLGELKTQTTSQIIDLQNDFLGIEKRRWIVANDETIPLTKSGQVSTGIHYNKNKLLISIEGYVKEVRGISSRSQGFQNQFQFTDAIGEYAIKGVDFLINKRFKKWSTWLSYSFNENNYTFENLNNGKPFSNNIAVTHAITLASNYNWKRLKFGLGLNWRTGKPFTAPQNTNPTTGSIINYSQPNANNLPDYFRVDLSANYNFYINQKTKVTTGFSLWNLTNKTNILNRYYSTNNSSDINQIENQSLGVTPNVSLRVDF